ncbi:IDEAL domain-containing protein [Bacillus infantis]|uniref:IDEAL domain-containing protein n=1 Tax=Bacillus infantis TaxID=324767 RepID=UPI003CE89C25
MNSEYKPNQFNQDQYLSSIHDLADKDSWKTRKILSQETTEYTDAVNEVIEKVQGEWLEAKRYEEIDKALDNKDVERFQALTSENWEAVL